MEKGSFFGRLDEYALHEFNVSAWHDIPEEYIEVCLKEKWFAFKPSTGAIHKIKDDGIVYERDCGGISTATKYPFRLHSRIYIGGE